MRFGSLFSGIGGFDLGFERAGMECAWQVEIDEACQRSLAGNFPGVVRHRDVKEVGKHNLDPVGLVCGGFPCQDLSVAGRRAGLAGERSGLWFEFHRILAEMLPEWVVIENVPGLLSSNGGRDFAVILRGLVELGYGVCWRVLDAQYFGVAQRRRRVFIVGHLGDGRAAEVLFEREGGGWDTAPSREKGQGVAGTLDGKSASSNRGSQANETEFLAVANDGPTSTLRGFGHGWQGQHNDTNPVIAFPDPSYSVQGNGSKFGSGRHNQDTFVAFSAGQSGKAYGIAANENVTPPLRAGASGTNQTPTIAFNTNEQGSAGNRIQIGADVSVTLQGEGGGMGAKTGMYLLPAWHENKGGSFTPSDHAKALRSGASHSYQGVGVRRLTPTECERLQGFPDGWTAGQSDSARYRQLGNAVCVNVIEWIGKRLVQLEKGST